MIPLNPAVFSASGWCWKEWSLCPKYSNDVVASINPCLNPAPWASPLEPASGPTGSSPLSVGGMDEVSKARNLKRYRLVAIKVLPER